MGVGVGDEQTGEREMARTKVRERGRRAWPMSWRVTPSEA